MTARIRFTKEPAMPRSMRMTIRAAAGAIALLAGAAAQASAPPEQPPAPPPTTPPAQQDESKPAQPPPSDIPDLDELLGLPGAGRGDRIADPAKEELEKRLSGAEIGDVFKQAVALMDQAARRLATEDAERAGIGTQRIQEDAVRKLDQLIAQLEQMANSKSRSRSSSSSGAPDKGRPQPSQQQARGDESRRGENNSEAEPPARRDGPLRPELDSSRAAWGALPERVRDMLLQGSSDRFSSMYEKMTESYYRRLAEEQRPQ